MNLVRTTQQQTIYKATEKLQPTALEPKVPWALHHVIITFLLNPETSL